MNSMIVMNDNNVLDLGFNGEGWIVSSFFSKSRGVDFIFGDFSGINHSYICNDDGLKEYEYGLKSVPRFINWWVLILILTFFWVFSSSLKSGICTSKTCQFYLRLHAVHEEGKKVDMSSIQYIFESCGSDLCKYRINVDWRNFMNFNSTQRIKLLSYRSRPMVEIYY